MMSKQFFVWLLGKRWRSKLLVWALIYMALIVVPNIIFYRDIQFNPAAFTQDWVKTILGLSFLYLVLQFQNYHAERNKKIFHLNRILLHEMILPMERILNCLIHIREEEHFISTLKKEWISFYVEAEKINLVQFKTEIDLPDHLHNFKTVHGLPFINNHILSMSGGERVNHVDHQKAIENVRNCLETFKKAQNAL
jgi:hypothetical protein